MKEFEVMKDHICNYLFMNLSVYIIEFCKVQLSPSPSYAELQLYNQFPQTCKKSETWEPSSWTILKKNSDMFKK